MPSIVSVQNLTKTYGSGFQALKSVNLEIEEGEILALLGPNGAGKTTLISTICGIVQPTSGRVRWAGMMWCVRFRAARGLIGLVPQEITLEPFETGVQRRQFFARAVRQGARSGPCGTGAAAVVAVGQEGQQDQAAVGRHEAAGADRQGAGA